MMSAGFEAVTSKKKGYEMISLTSRRLLSAAVLVCSMAGAQAWMLTLSEVTAHSFENLPAKRDVFDPGTNSTLIPEDGLCFLVINGKATVTWAEGEKKASIHYKQFVVTVGETAYSPVGTYMGLGVFERNYREVSLDFDREEESAEMSMLFNAVFVVPDDGTPSLSVKEATIALEPVPGPQPNPGGAISVTVDKVEPYGLGPSGGNTFNKKVTTNLQHKLAVGRMISVTITMTPNGASEYAGGKRFTSLEGRQFDLVVRGVGLQSKSSAGRYWAEGDVEPKTLSLVFHVPTDYAGGDLLFYGTKVAEVAL